jgi:hypothetical protein
MITVVDNRHDGADGRETITRTHTHAHRQTDGQTDKWWAVIFLEMISRSKNG